MSREPAPRALTGAVVLLVPAQIAALSLWFSAAAVLPSLAEAHGLPLASIAGLATAVQIGFVTGALLLAITGAADRVEPRRLFAACALLAAAANLALLIARPDGAVAWASRAVVGAALAGVYPVGLRIAVGWSQTRRGLLTSLLVGALTLGSASPHLVAALGGAAWERTLMVTSGLGVLAALLIQLASLGPFHRRAARFDPGAVVLAWRNPGIRAAYLAYFGHMWELYAFWAWVGVVATSAAAGAGIGDARVFGAAVAFAAIGLGGLACVPSGWFSDRHGRARVARWALTGSLVFGLASAAAHAAGPLWLLTALLVLWGIAIIPDSSLFSALVADHAPPDKAGSLMTLQTALGFALSALTVQVLPWLAETTSWPIALAALALGPAFGIAMISRLVGREGPG